MDGVIDATPQIVLLFRFNKKAVKINSSFTSKYQMDRLKQIEAFVSFGDARQPVGGGAGEGVTPAIIGRRLDALEARLGVKLLLRTTRKLTITLRARPFSRIARKPQRSGQCRGGGVTGRRSRQRPVARFGAGRLRSPACRAAGGAISCRPTRR
jgi:hypothetical protein